MHTVYIISYVSMYARTHVARWITHTYIYTYVIICILTRKYVYMYMHIHISLYIYIQTSRHTGIITQRHRHTAYKRTGIQTQRHKYRQTNNQACMHAYLAVKFKDRIRLYSLTFWLVHRTTAPSSWHIRHAFPRNVGDTD